MKHGILKGLFAVAVSCLLTVPAWAGGFYQYEIGSDDTGLASAGFASRAQDAATLFSNPAGMTRLDKSEFMVGVNAFYFSAKFDPNEQTSRSNLFMPDGSRAANGNASFFQGAPGVFFVNKLSDRAAAGFGIFAFFGGPAQFATNSVMRYQCITATLEGITFMPSFAYKVSDKVSLGLGVNGMYTILDDKIAINNRGPLDPTAPDGSLEIKDNEWGIGGKIGLLYEPTKETRVGLTYLSKTKVNFNAVPEMLGERPAFDVLVRHRSVDLSMSAPQQVILSVYHDLTDKLAVMADAGFENWQDFGKVNISLDNAANSLTVNAHYQNTWHVALGTQYKLSEPWKLSFGAAYDSSMVDGANRTASLPVGQQWRFGTGVQYAFSPTMILSGSYEYTWTGDLPMNVTGGPLSGTVAGEFNNVSLQVLTIVMRWKL